MHAWLILLRAVLKSAFVVIPLIIEFFITRKKDPLKKARDRATAIQQHASNTARLLAELKGEELTRREHYSLLVVRELLRERRLRNKTRPTS